MNIEPEYVITSKLTGTAPWYVGCYAKAPDGDYEVLWQIIGSASKVVGNFPQESEATFFFPNPASDNIIRLTIKNRGNASDMPFCTDYPITITKNTDAGKISNFTMTRAALKVDSIIKFGLNVTVMLPCVKWDFDDGQVECNRDIDKYHKYQSPKIINGKVIIYMLPPSGICDCKGTQVGSKEFSLLVYQS